MNTSQIEIVGVDHGWSNMKTKNFIFSSGIKEITTEPAFYENVLEYEGKYYKVGTGRVGVSDTKVENDNYYLLTLASIAKELEERKKRKADIILSAGLPLTRFGGEKPEFHSYLSKNKTVKYHFEGKEYEITIQKVCIYPQCYAAVADKLKSFPDKIIIVDLGSWTIDIMPIFCQIPDEAKCVTIPEGIITSMHEINNQCVRQFNTKLDEIDIEMMIRRGNSSLPMEYQKVIKQGFTEFAEKVQHHLNEGGFKIETTPMAFVGGGATVMKHYSGLTSRQIRYIEDIRANARGYEYLANLALQSGALKIG